MSCKGFVYINNPLLVMVKIKLIESLRSIKRTTMPVQWSENQDSYLLAL